MTQREDILKEAIATTCDMLDCDESQARSLMCCIFAETKDRLVEIIPEIIDQARIIRAKNAMLDVAMRLHGVVQLTLDDDGEMSMRLDPFLDIKETAGGFVIDMKDAEKAATIKLRMENSQSDDPCNECDNSLG